ncbi:IDEAL domain-containing protein [Paenibacillus sp. EKM102P]|uniref:IDEAL domain-containing protein n=1 Tax=unclassified Paenibacillus TaxID=185978 RepID=UPI00142D9B7E|nr:MULTISPECIES: IDEAL domain-containing protein [unclassified Paenibacillus]KAF6620609.1 IDEAL domain-containing protein [Paenibacillus sp. EKM101P]KAF6623602.1 IDEAL domain-containing protein [Paenibacillus sp. EKM102P]KAF6633837.1 IDEAL domain-containing protein [Paenibacillus sp. EKM10P]KAF6649362.1 IDEAL domain-containing protein [Paenibacillus sp. EKM11P]
MKFLNQDDIFQILRKSLKKHYGNFRSEPKIEIDVDVMASKYDFYSRKINFSGKIVSFKYNEEIYKRRLTLKEIEGMIKLELGGEVNVAAYINEIEEVLTRDSYNKHTVLVATVTNEELSLDKDCTMTLIDMAIDMNDKEWFIELSNRYKQL